MLGVCFKGVHTPVYSLFFSGLHLKGVCVYVCFAFFCEKISCIAYIGKVGRVRIVGIPTLSNFPTPPTFPNLPNPTKKGIQNISALDSSS